MPKKQVVSVALAASALAAILIRYATSDRPLPLRMRAKITSFIKRIEDARTDKDTPSAKSMRAVLVRLGRAGFDLNMITHHLRAILDGTLPPEYLPGLQDDVDQVEADAARNLD
jgi:hypothetical protein